MKDSRYKEIMDGLGMPDSISLLGALQQVANEVAQEVHSDTVYTVHARRGGHSETHSYIVGVFSSEHLAIAEAKREEDSRYGKYQCEILAWDMDYSSAGDSNYNPLLINTMRLDKEGK